MRYIAILLSLSFSAFLLNAIPQSRIDGEKPQVEKPRPQKSFPKHWGSPPRIQVRDMVKLPGKFGMGSSTLASWIRENLKKDAEKKRPEDKKPENNKPKPKPPEKPVPPIVPIPPADVKEKMDEYKATQKDLQSGLVEKIKELGKKPTKEAVRKVVEKYQKENANVINSQKELGKEIYDWQKENRPERPKRPEPPKEVKAKIAQVKIAKNSLDIARKSLLQELKGKSKEEKDVLVKEFKQSQKEKHKELKDAQKALAEEVRNRIQTKDRRE